MGKSKVIVCALLALASTAAAQGITFPSLVRKGAIETLSVEPAEPTTASSVVLCATVADPLRLVRTETQRIGSTFMVKIYWSESTTGSSSWFAGLCQEPLGKLAKGNYFAIVQSYCDDRLAGSKQLTFKVVEGSGPAMRDVICDVQVTPTNPTTSSNTVVKVFGRWPTSGYSQSVSLARLSGRTGTGDLYWESPQGPVEDTDESYFYHEAAMKMSLAGTYTIRVRVYLDGLLVDWEEISVEVTEGSGSGWTWDPFFWGIDLP